MLEVSRKCWVCLFSTRSLSGIINIIQMYFSNNGFEKEKIIMLRKIIFILGASVMMYSLPTLGAMNSASFSIDSDFVGVGGGSGSSVSFDLGGTVGQAAPGESSSASFVINGGFQQVDENSISLDLTSASLNFGDLVTNQVKTVSTVASVGTNAVNGYTLSIGDVSGSSIRAVSDGVVTAGNEEYGVTTTGTDALVAGDVAVVAGTNLATSNAATVSTATTLTFKASISNNTPSGAYNQNIVLTASANP